MVVGECVWLPGVCMVVGGHMCGCWGACMIVGGHAWLPEGGMRGCQGACVVAGGVHGCRGVCVVARGVHGCFGGVRRIRRERAVRILLECLLVLQCKITDKKSFVKYK